ncbi:hypothetical protein TIFTF001_040478 [Ficus carica]|uniref:Uncharacterized protein n=1 Tax=Ficus carica TaxID=3494 RepID=A0AA87Z181_FICCA|nr:hypothetical protein TIFTF001_040478 [Ficus carica]
MKLKLAACFIEESDSTGALLLEKIKSEIKDIKAYFAEEVIKSYTDEELLRLVFLDGYAMLVVIYWVEKCLNKSYDLPEQWSNMQPFRNVQELKAAGIKFKPTDSLKTLTFHSRFMIRGQLLLPTFVVDNSTARMLLNLVAYEVNLLDLLVDNEQDVKDLRSAGIIRNCLSSDNDVAQLINSIGSNCSLPPSNNFAHVRYIDKHYKRRCAIWIAQVCHAHFSSPLTVLALVAATVVLALTAVQTWYAVNPESKDTTKGLNITNSTDLHSS